MMVGSASTIGCTHGILAQPVFAGAEIAGRHSGKGLISVRAAKCEKSGRAFRIPTCGLSLAPGPWLSLAS